ncbi:MAG: NUDIX hydrolase [Gammaproteobacteria bacterium]|nr:NUDIX hydrolase [Gammaproteobacteria bacterium]
MSRNLHVTVAAITEREGRFLLVEETVAGELLINQPAGHLEIGESLSQAVIREALEETACDFQPEALVGLYLWQVPDSELTYLRVAFCGAMGAPLPHRELDSGIERTLWLRRDEIIACQSQWRSPLVLRCVDDYLAGRRYPLDVLIDMLPHA